MNELNNKIIILGKGYKNIIAEKIFDVTNDHDCYILIYAKENYTHKIYMSIDEIDSFFKNYQKKKEINMKDFVEKTYIIKNNQEIPIKEGRD